MHCRFATRRRSSVFFANCLLACGAIFAGFVATGSPGASASGHNTALGGADSATCTDPVVTDRYDGFRVGVPSGWYLSSTGGLIVVSRDFTDQYEGFVQTAYVSRTQSPSVFLSKILGALAHRVSSASESLTFQLAGANATLTGHVGKVAIAGAASVSFRPVQGRFGSELGAVSGYWAPASQLAGERGLLASIGACYAPEAGTLFRFYKDPVYGYTLPPGWTVGHRTSDLLFLDDGPDASANYLFVGPYTSGQGVTDGQSLMTYVFRQLGLSIDTVLTTLSAPNQTSVTGATEQEFITQFLCHVGSKPLVGVARVISSTGGGVTTGVLRVALATPQLWNSLNGALIWVMYGIQHDFTQDLLAIQQAQEQLAGFSRQVAGFDQALNGTDLVRDPATGIQYEAPYSDYQNTGPQGPGYYIGPPGAEHKLTLLTH